MVKHTTVKKSNNSGAKVRTSRKKNYKSPYQLYKENGGFVNPKLTLDECKQYYNDREDDDPDCEYYLNHPLYEWRGADACGEGGWEKTIGPQDVFNACKVYGALKGPAFAVKILNKYINKACSKMDDPMMWAMKNEKFLRELGTIAKLQKSPCCVHTPFASEIPNCCGVYYNGEHISLCNALLGAIKRNDACHDIDRDNSTWHSMYISVIVSGEKVNELKSKYDAYLQDKIDKFLGWESEGFLINTIFNANLTADGKLQFDFHAVWERSRNEKMKEKYVKETTKNLLLWNVCGSVKRIEEGLHFADWDIRYEY